MPPVYCLGDVFTEVSLYLNHRLTPEIRLMLEIV